MASIPIASTLRHSTVEHIRRRNESSLATVIRVRCRWLREVKSKGHAGLSSSSDAPSESTSTSFRILWRGLGDFNGLKAGVGEILQDLKETFSRAALQCERIVCNCSAWQQFLIVRVHRDERPTSVCILRAQSSDGSSVMSSSSSVSTRDQRIRASGMTISGSHPSTVRERTCRIRWGEDSIKAVSRFA